MKKLEPDSAIFYALHDAGVSSETALRRSGHKVTNPSAPLCPTFTPPLRVNDNSTFTRAAHTHLSSKREAF
jgi:hypothetical protein